MCEQSNGQALSWCFAGTQDPCNLYEYLQTDFVYILNYCIDNVSSLLVFYL